MPNIFVSYSSKDEEVASSLIRELTGDGVVVSMAHNSLYVRQTWARDLCAAIADCDVLVIVWSKEAAKSQFVELEWCMGLALKRTIFPWLLDDTPLPDALTAFPPHSAKNARIAASDLIQSITHRSLRGDFHQENAVQDRLNTIQTEDLTEVLQAVKGIYQTKGGTVGRGGIQPPVSALLEKGPRVVTRAGKNVVERWQTLVGLAVAVVTLIGLLLDIPAKIGGILGATAGTPTFELVEQSGERGEGDSKVGVSQNFQPLLEPGKQRLAEAQPQPIAGTILDSSTHHPISGVVVSFPRYAARDTTNAQGYFIVRIRSLDQEEVELMAQKEGYETYRTIASPGNMGLSFAMRRGS